MKQLGIGKEIAEKQGSTILSRPRRKQSPAFKVKVEIAAIKGEKSLGATPVRRASVIAELIEARYEKRRNARKLVMP